MRDNEHLYFPGNLRLVVARFPNLARAAEAFGVTRQQLNKYLSGTQMPSILVLSRIAAVAGIGPDEMLIRPEEFRTLLAANSDFDLLSSDCRSIFNDFLNPWGCFRGPIGVIGGYYEVFCAPTMGSNLISRTLVLFYDFGGMKLVRYLGKGGGRKARSGDSSHRRPVAVVLCKEDRVQIAGYQNIDHTGPRIGFSILTPPTAAHPLYMTGMVLSTDSRRMRPVVSSRIVFRKIPEGESILEHARRGGLLPQGDLDPFVLAMLREPLI